MVRNVSQIPVRNKTVVFTKPSSDTPSNFFIEPILNGKRDVNTYKFIFQSTTDAEKHEMIQNVIQLGAYSCTAGLNFFLGYVTH